MEKEKSGEEKLAEAKAAVLKWRKSCKPRSRVPEHLWDRAMVLLEHNSMNRVSQELGLYYEGLKKRSERRSAISKPSKPSGFLEMQVNGYSTRMHECVVHLKDRGMEIQFKSQDASTLGAIVREMLRAEG